MADTVSFRGGSGNSYPFEIYNQNQAFNNVSAVYIFAQLTSSNTLKPLYIGESGELGTRIANHEKWPCANRNGVTHICVHQVAGEKARLDVETDLRRNYHTPCNDQ